MRFRRAGFENDVAVFAQGGALRWVCGGGISVGDDGCFESVLFQVLRLGDFCHCFLILGLGCDGALLRGMEKRKESERDCLNEVAAASTIQNQIFRPSSLLEGFPDYDYDYTLSTRRSIIIIQ